MRLLLVTLVCVIFVGCDSGADLSDHGDSVSASIQAAQQFYKEYHEQRHAKSSVDSTEAVVLAEMVRQYPPDWTQAAAWPDGHGGMIVATLIGAEKPAISFSHDSVFVVRTLMADINSDGTVTASRLLKFISVQPLDPSQFQYYVKQWSSGDYGTSVMIVAEYSLGFESQRSRLSLPQDSLHNSVDMSLRERFNKGKVEDERAWCWVSDYVRAGEVCFQGADGCNYIPPRLIAITCICVSMCDQDQGRTG